MAQHPVPKGYKSKPAGEIIRQGTNGRLSINPFMNGGEYDPEPERRNPGDCYDLIDDDGTMGDD